LARTAARARWLQRNRATGAFMRSTPVSRILSRHEAGDDHLSGMRVTAHLGAIARSDGPPGAPASRRTDRAILLQVGFTRARVTATPRELLPHDFTLARKRAVCFCGTFLRVSPTGRYPAPCPVKPGLSSPKGDHPAYSAGRSIPHPASGVMVVRAVLAQEKNGESLDSPFFETGGGKETRTPDPHAASVMLYQLSYAPRARRDRRDRGVFTSGQGTPLSYDVVRSIENGSAYKIWWRRGESNP